MFFLVGYTSGIWIGVAIGAFQIKCVFRYFELTLGNEDRLGGALRGPTGQRKAGCSTEFCLGFCELGQRVRRGSSKLWDGDKVGYWTAGDEVG